jgi:ABC transporter with metal-binding/Fe-S-binding domain ATP-binding protein
MKAGVLFSGGKDSTFAIYLAKKNNIEISCLISLFSKNKESYMFHTPSIHEVKKQAEVMNHSLLTKETGGKKEKELHDLHLIIEQAIKKYDIQSVITGAVESAYQASRIQKICDNLGIDCFNPLWKKNQIELLQDIINNSFEVIITGVFAYPLNDQWLGKYIDKNFLETVILLNDRYKINPAGEGGEFETFVLNCPLFKRRLKVIQSKTSGKANAWSLEIKVE